MTDTHIKIKPVTPRVQYTANGSTTEFPYSFAIFDESDMIVYVDDTIIETGYTVSGAGQTDGGNVTFDSAPADGSIITLLRNVPIERMTDFQEGGTFRPKNLNDEFDRQTAFAQQTQEALTRCVKVDPTSSTNPEEVIPKVEALYDDIANIDAVAGDLANIDTVATGMSDVGTCAANMEDIQAAPGAATTASGAAEAAAASAAAAAISAAGTKFKLFHHDWFDYQLNDLAWLRADTFSWQDGTVYSDAYDHLVADYNGGTSQTETVGSYTITYVLASDGHKITTDETNVTNIYNESGVAWYYILDTANTRFKLPRENPAREELIQTIRAKGSGITVGWTDGTNFSGTRGSAPNNVGVVGFDETKYGTSVGTATTNAGAWANGNVIGITTDSTKSGIISDMTESTSVYKGHKHLYFYVGNYAQSAVEQTAGLNSELFNGKVDLSLNNMNPSQTAKETMVGWGIPDYDSGATITLNTSGVTFTPTKSGMVKLIREGGDGQNGISMYKGSNSSGVLLQIYLAASQFNTGYAYSWVPVCKGETYFIVTNNTNVGKAIFYPARGA